MINQPHEAHLPASVDAPEWRVSRRQRLLSIQNKIIIPYLSITLLVAGVGTYIVTRLVAGSLQERLSNQLIESGRVATDSIVRSENRHLEALRLMTFSSGVANAIQEDDSVYLGAVINSLADNAAIPDAAVLDSRGNTLVTRGDFAANRDDFREWTSVQKVLDQQQDERGDKFSEIVVDSTPIPLFVVSAPVYPTEELPDSLAGVIIVATPLSDLLPNIKLEALADVVMYDMQGSIASTTFVLDDSDRGDMELTPEFVSSELDLLTQQEQSTTLAVQVNKRSYQGLYVPLRVRDQSFGLIGVFLSDEFIVLAGGTSARIFAGLFAGAAFLIVMIGLLVASTIISPVRQLVSVAQEVTDGDLSRRSSLSGRDEIGFLGFTFDIMTHRLEERTLQLEEEAARLNSILATSQTGMVMVGRQGEYVFMNQAARNFLKPGANNPETLNRISRNLLRLQPRDRLEINNFIPATQTTRVMGDDRNRHIGTLIALQDITQEELAGQLKDRFIARVSHELRTPLAAIKGYSDIISAMLEMERMPQMRHANGIAEQTMVLDKMIVELLDISQMSAGTFSVRRGDMDLRNLLLRCIDDRKSELEEARLGVETHLTDAACIIQGDERRLQWAIQHVLDNAIKYTLPDGKIVCELSDPIDRMHHLVITDTGVGIRPVDQSLVFDAYYRREAETPDGEIIDPRGMGLGLYVVRNVIRAHGGKVALESTPGEGTTLILMIPAGS